MTGSGGSNFKRQNTVDAATIKENSARVSASRPTAPKNSPGQLDTSEFTLSLYNICKKISCQYICLFVMLCLSGALTKIFVLEDCNSPIVNCCS